MDMNRQDVSSSNLRSIGYDSESQTLEIEFKDGGIYQYFNVPESTYNALMSASSPGSFFHHNLRGRFGDTKIR